MFKWRIFNTTLPGSGPLPKITQRAKCVIVRVVKGNPRVTSKKGKVFLAMANIHHKVHHKEDIKQWWCPWQSCKEEDHCCCLQFVQGHVNDKESFYQTVVKIEESNVLESPDLNPIDAVEAPEAGSSS